MKGLTKMLGQCLDYTCINRDMHSGNCKITACIKQIQNNNFNINDIYTMKFPHTIGNITFYDKNELIEWVKGHQIYKNNEVK